MQQPTPTKISRGAERSKEISDVLAHIGAIETAIQEARDVACLYADLAHELPDTSKAIRVDAQALRGVMTRLYAGMEDAMELLGTVQAMVSLLDENPNLNHSPGDKHV